MQENELVELINSWENLALIVKHIGNHPEHLEMLMKLVFDDSDPKNWRAAWMVDKIHEQHPDLILPYLSDLTDFVLTTNHDSKKRHLLKLISLHEIPENKMAVMLNYCIDVFTSASAPIAVRAHAMQVLFNIAQKEPDFAGELIEIIQNEMELHGSAGISARGRQLIKKLIALT